MRPTIEMDYNWRTILLEHDIGGCNIVVDDAERVKVTNPRQDPNETCPYGIIQRTRATRKKVGFAPILRVDSLKQRRRISLETES